jgi:transcriptional regulator with XRE-family HTH domain
MDLGHQIKARRQVLKITQRDLAREVEVSVQYMSSIEQNQRMPSLPVLLKIAEKLQVTLNDLVLGQPGNNPDVIAAIQGDADLSAEEKRFLIDLIRIWRRYKK